MAKDVGAKDKDYYMEKVRAAEQERIRQSQERLKSVKVLQSSPSNERVKGTVVNLRPQTQQVSNENKPVNVKQPYFDQSFSLENKGLFDQLIKQVGQGIAHQANRLSQAKQQQKAQQEQQAKQTQQIQQAKQSRRA